MREASAKVAVADSHYGNTANLIALAQRKIRAHVADLRHNRFQTPRAGLQGRISSVDKLTTVEVESNRRAADYVTAEFSLCAPKPASDHSR